MTPAFCWRRLPFPGLTPTRPFIASKTPLHTAGSRPHSNDALCAACCNACRDAAEAPAAFMLQSSLGMRSRIAPIFLTNVEYCEFTPPAGDVCQPLIRTPQYPTANHALPRSFTVMNKDRSASQTAGPDDRDLSPRTRSTVTARTIDKYIVPGAVDQRRNLRDGTPSPNPRRKVEKQHGSCNGSQLKKGEIVLDEGGAIRCAA